MTTSHSSPTHDYDPFSLESMKRATDPKTWEGIRKVMRSGMLVISVVAICVWLLVLTQACLREATYPLARL